MNAVTAWAPPTRLQLPAPVADRFGIDAIKWKALVETIYPNATSIDSVVMALSYCEARKLDPFKRPVHIVPVWSKAANGMVDTVWPGISELRTTAMRTGLYAGKDKTEFGPDVTMTLGDVQVTFPEWAQTTVYRMVPGIGRCPFEGPTIYWTEAYATAGRNTKAPNDMWKKRPRGQLDKCSEAAALRTAFPEELGGEFAAEEMDGQSFGVARDVTPRSGPNLTARLSAPPEGPSEGFNAVQAEQHTEISDADQPPSDPASEQPASDGIPQPRTDAGDPFTGDRAPAGEAETAGDQSDEGPGSAVEASGNELVAWADTLISRLPFAGLADLKTMEAGASYRGRIKALRDQASDKAAEVEKAMKDALEAFG